MRPGAPSHSGAGARISSGGAVCRHRGSGRGQGWGGPGWREPLSEGTEKSLKYVESVKCTKTVQKKYILYACVRAYVCEDRPTLGVEGVDGLHGGRELRCALAAREEVEALGGVKGREVGGGGRQEEGKRTGGAVRPVP